MAESLLYFLVMALSLFFVCEVGADGSSHKVDLVLMGKIQKKSEKTTIRDTLSGNRGAWLSNQKNP